MKTLVLLLLATTAAADDTPPPLVPAALPQKITAAVREEPSPPAFVKHMTPIHEVKSPPPAIPVRVSTTSIRIALKF